MMGEGLLVQKSAWFPFLVSLKSKGYLSSDVSCMLVCFSHPRQSVAALKITPITTNNTTNPV